MKQQVTKGIVLVRTNFDEADRIITFLTPDYGKIRLMARGTRRVKSKLAGGIELFSVSDITFIKGRGEIGTLSSSRLRKHYARVITNIDRTMVGYELIRKVHKATEDEPESEYFDLLVQTFEALDDTAINTDVINIWFAMQLLRLSGHGPNLHTDVNGDKLSENSTYHFDFGNMSFTPSSSGMFDANNIKFLRLGFSGNNAKVLQMVSNSHNQVSKSMPLVEQMRLTFLS